MLDGALSDIRFGIRAARRAPGFAAAAIASIALAIAAASTMFSAFHAVFLRPQPFRDADRLVNIWKTTGTDLNLATVADLRFWRGYAHSFESFGTFDGYRMATLTGGREPAKLMAATVSAGLFPVLQSPPLLGRVLSPRDFEPASSGAIVLAWGTWQGQFAGDPKILGREILLDGQSYVVVGVMPASFRFPWRGYGAWIPSRREVTSPAETSVQVTARLRSGVSMEDAERELEALRPALARLYPESDRHWRTKLENAATRETEGYREAFVLLFAAVGVLVLIGCLNVANLLLARSVARTAEFATRTALGAPRARLFRQVLTESLTLAFAGGALGLLISLAGMRAVAASMPVERAAPGLQDTGMDLTVLLFGLCATTLVGVAFGIAPALRTSGFSLRGPAEAQPGHALLRAIEPC